MSLNVETGTGASNSESYISVASADTYFSDRGNTTWSVLTTAQKEQALRKATDFMLQRYRPYWLGYRNSSTQALDWPRAYVSINPAEVVYQLDISNTIVPVEVQRACAELALRSTTYTDGLLPDVSDLVTEETIGPITTKYDSRSPDTPLYKSIDAMLSIYLKDGGMNSFVSTVQRA
jgi:hypothetical protein